MRRKLNVFLIVLCSTIVFSGCQENRTNNANSKVNQSIPDSIQAAIDYNDTIVKLQQDFMDPANDLMMLNDSNLLQKLDRLRVTTKKCIKKLEQIESPQENKDLKASAYNLFNFYLNLMNGPWEKAIRFYINNGRQEMGKQDMKKLSSILLQASKKEKAMNKNFREAQRKYAKEHGFRIPK